MIRAPYIESYWTPTDNLQCKSSFSPTPISHEIQLTRLSHKDWTGFIVLWSNIESAIGLIACSIPSLRALLMQTIKKPSTLEPTSLVTIGGGREGAGSRSKGFRNPTDQGISFVSVHASANRDWTRLQDGDSDSAGEESQVRGIGGIRAEYTYNVEISRLKASERGLSNSKKENGGT